MEVEVNRGCDRIFQNPSSGGGGGGGGADLVKNPDLVKTKNWWGEGRVVHFLSS